MQGGELPSESILDLVRTALDPETVVPLTDDCRVLVPGVVEYEVQATYYIGRDRAAMSPTIQLAAEQAVDDYITWQRNALGRDILPDKLISLLQTAGVKRVEILSPTFTQVSSWAVAQESSVSVIYGGLEDA
jgi:phage-related baseplate assembly protein